MDIKKNIDQSFVEAGSQNNNSVGKMMDSANKLKDEITEKEEIPEAKKKGKKEKKEKKIEANEATSSASSGGYETNAIWAKDKKNWRGAAKPQIPGGKFVKVKKKCKTFPYCNQGDIKALSIFENSTVKEIISELSDEMGMTIPEIKKILFNEMIKRKITI